VWLITLNVAFKTSFGTGILISTLLAIDLALKFARANTLYSILVDETFLVSTSIENNGFNYIRNCLALCFKC